MRSSLLVVVLAATALIVPATTTAHATGAPVTAAPAGSVTTSWVGNTYGGADNQWIQPGMQGLWVAPDGTAYAESVWNEGSRELRGYRDGQVFGNYTYQHENDIPNGGTAVTGDADYVYAAVRFGNTAGIMRYDHALDPAPFSGGTNPQGATLVVDSRYEYLTGLAAGGGNLYVADPESYTSQTDDGPQEGTVVTVYATAHLAAGPTASFAAPRTRGLAVDGDGDIWALEQADTTHAAAVVRYTPAGRPTGQVVTGVADPTSISVDTSVGGAGRLLVTDNGPDQDIKVFGGLDTTPQLTATIGVTGGVQAGPVRGAIGPGRFDGPAAVGVDAAGDVDVVNNGTPGFAVQDYGQGSSLESYTPTGSLSWEVYGQKYDTAAAIDPATGTDVYTAFDHYTFDASKPAGQQWTRVGWTLDATAYPDDPRIQYEGEGQLPTNPTVRTLDGHRFLFMGNGLGDALDIFRFAAGGETAIPSGSLDQYQGKASPSSGAFIWRDTNGDGNPYGNVASEYSVAPGHTNSDVMGWYVDSAGDVWQATRNHGIREFPFGGLDSVGNPVYSFATMRSFPDPGSFTDARRISYDPATDTLVLSGYTTSHPTPSWVQGDYKFAGSTLAEFPHFLASTTPTAAWSTVLPYTQTSSDAAHKPITLAVAGGYAFVGYFTGADNQLNSEVDIFSLATGAAAGVLTPGPSIGSRSGNTDMEDGTSAYLTSSGTYLVFDEDDGFDKTIVYEWTPPGAAAPVSAAPVTTPPPAAPTAPTAAPVPVPTPVTVAAPAPISSPAPVSSPAPAPTKSPTAPTPTVRRWIMRHLHLLTGVLRRLERI